MERMKTEHKRYKINEIYSKIRDKTDKKHVFAEKTIDLTIFKHKCQIESIDLTLCQVCSEHDKTKCQSMSNTEQNIDKQCQTRYDKKEQSRTKEEHVVEGNELKQLRERAGLTQQQLSQQTGVSRSLISQWENGVISVSATTKKRFTDFFGVDALPAKPEKKQEQPRIVMSEAARQELGELTKQYMALNHNLEQMLGRLTESELMGLKESASALMQAVDTETVFRQVKSFQQHKTETSREALTEALARLLGEDS